MADAKPLKLVDQGGGVGRLEEFGAGDRVPAENLPATEWSAETVSQAEAEAGTATTRRAWTAERVRQAIVAWWAGVSSPFGRTLVAAVSALMARQELGLGNAATATVQSSATDSTSGRLLGVGAFGLGTTDTPLVSNADTAFVSGFFRMDGGVGGPFGGGSFGSLIVAGRSNQRISQVFMPIGTTEDARLYIRTYSSENGWTTWRLIYSQRTILGTVSQSAGIPTGAIIERGSNANGRFTKYADGTVVMDKSGDAITTNPVATVGVVTSVDANKLRYGFWF